MINVFTEGRVKNRRMYEDFACEVINELLLALSNVTSTS